MCPASPSGAAGGLAESTQRALTAGLLGTPRAVNRVGTPHPRAWEGRGQESGDPSQNDSQIGTASDRSTPLSPKNGAPPGAVSPSGRRNPAHEAQLGRHRPQGQLLSEGSWEQARQSSRRNSNSPMGTASFTAPEEALFEKRLQQAAGRARAGLGVGRGPPPATPTTSRCVALDKAPHPAWASLGSTALSPKQATHPGRVPEGQRRGKGRDGPHSCPKREGV